jgi:hypothetical protein
MLNRSLRAVFKKESWMFCAGLLLSIADLLKFFELRTTNLRLRPWPQGKLKTTACSRRPLAEETRGEQPASSPPRFRGCAAQQVATSTIRCPPALFNPEVAENLIS